VIAKPKTEIRSEIHAAAREYGEKFGWRIVPLKERDKLPLLESWQKISSAAPEMIDVWWRQWPAANCGVQLGPRSGVVDVECDTPEAEAALVELFDGDPPVVPTYIGNRGKHRLFQWSDSMPAMAVVKLDGVEFRLGGGGKGAQSVLPPSIHPNGAVYKWLVPMEDAPLIPLPAAIIDKLHDGNRPLLGSKKGGDDKAERFESRAPDPLTPVTAGERNELATAFVGRLLADLADPFDSGAIKRAWGHTVNWNKNNKPPLDDKELRTIYNSIVKREREQLKDKFQRTQADCDDIFGLDLDDTQGANASGEQEGEKQAPVDALENFNHTDSGNAKRFKRDHFESVRHVHEWQKFLVWDLRRWKLDDTGEVIERAKQTNMRMHLEALSLTNRADRDALSKHALKSESAKSIDAMLKLAKSISGIPLSPDQLDVGDYLLNCLNCTLNLKSGESKRHDRGDLLTKLAPVDYLPGPTVSRALWDETVAKIFGNDAAAICYAQKLFGSALIANANETILPILCGNGSNGKTLLTEAILAAVGDYGLKASSELLLTKQGSSHPTERADLFGKRLVLAAETDEDRQLSESTVKELTGGDTVRARRMREDFWSFRPSFTIFLTTNHKPRVRGVDDAIWRRLVILPFTQRFWDPDKGESGPPELRADKRLKEKLHADLSGVLAWLVEGCLAWQAEGLGQPLCVREATKEYRATEDVLGTFFDAKLKLVPESRTRAAYIGDQYVAWSRDNGEQPISTRRLGEFLASRGLTRKVSNGIWWEGVEIR